MNCSTCGHEINAGERFCSNCGNPLATLPSVDSVNTQSFVGTVFYSGLWRRFAAWILDVVVLVLCEVVLVWAFEGRSAVQGTSSLAGSELILIFLLEWVYFALMESSSYQATAGKMALGIKVVDLQGGRISFARASVRFLAKYLSAFIMGIGFLMAAFTQRKQALHDILADTLVVIKTVGPEQLQTEAKQVGVFNMHKLAFVTLVLGLVSLYSWTLAVVLGHFYPPALGHYSPATGEAGPVIVVLMLLTFFLDLATWVTGVIALAIIKRRGQKGMGATLTGMVLAAIPFIGGYFIT